MNNPKIAIFDLTDCEGCELQFLSLKEKLLEFSQDYEIAAWRLVEPTNNPIPKVDIAIVQGTVITQKDIEILKKVRENSMILVALGECARTGWIPTWIKKEEVPAAIDYVYDKNYQPKRVDALALKDVVKVDYELAGCPVELNILEEFLEKIPEIIQKSNIKNQNVI